MGFDSQSKPYVTDMALAPCGTHMPTVAVTMWGFCDRMLAHQIFICLLCSVQILQTGEMHYVWISAGVASDKKYWTQGLSKGKQIHQICFQGKTHDIVHFGIFK